MTMHTVHSPKPKVFGEGYGAHLAYNLKLMRMFSKLALQIFINAIIPGLYYENTHWKIIELYHTMRGTRHGTNNDHRCNECGGDLLSSEDGHNRRAELKDIEIQCQRVEECDRALDAIGDTKPETWGDLFATEYDGDKDNISLTNPARPIVAKYTLDTSEDESSDK